MVNIRSIIIVLPIKISHELSFLSFDLLIWLPQNVFSSTCLPAGCCNKSRSGDRRNGRVLLVIVLDAFKPLQVYDAKHGQRQANSKKN